MKWAVVIHQRTNSWDLQRVADWKERRRLKLKGDPTLSLHIKHSNVFWNEKNRETILFDDSIEAIEYAQTQMRTLPPLKYTFSLIGVN